MSIGSGAGGGLSPLGVRMVVEGFSDFIKKQKAASAGVAKTSKELTGVAATSKKADSQFRSLTKQVALVGAGFLGAQAVIRGFRAIISGTIGAAIEFESSFAGVRKTVDGSEQDLQALSSTIRRMALDIPLSTTELNRLAETAGQLGIQGTRNVAQFVEVVAKLGATTNLVGSQGATVLARFMNIMSTVPGRVKELAGVLVDLGNNSATTEAEIANMALRIAGTGAVVGLSEAEVLGLAAALSSLGLRADAGGSAISRTLATVAKAVKSGTAELAIFAEVSELSIEEFSRLFEQDAVAALQAFILGLDGVNEAGGNVFAVLEELGLADRRVERALLSAAKGSDTFTDAINLAKEAAADAGAALDIEFNRRLETTAARAQLARNALNDIGIEVGTVFLGAISGAADALANMARETAINRELTDELTASYAAAAEAAGALKDAQDELQKSILDQRIELAQTLEGLSAQERQLVAINIRTDIYGGSLAEVTARVRDFRDSVERSTGIVLTEEEAIEALEFEMKVLIAREIEASQATDQLTGSTEDLEDATEDQTGAVAAQRKEYKPLTDSIEETIIANRDLDRGLGPVAANMDAVAAAAANAAEEIFGVAGEMDRFIQIQAGLSITKAEERAARFAEGVASFLGDTSDVRGLSFTDIRELAERGGGGGGGGPDFSAEIAAEFGDAWTAAFDEVTRAADDLNEARSEDFRLNLRLLDLREALLDIERQITRETAPQAVEEERITDRLRLLDLAENEFELAAAQIAVQSGADSDAAEAAQKAVDDARMRQAPERELLEAQQRRARLEVDSIRDSFEERQATIEAEVILTENALAKEIAKREEALEVSARGLKIVELRIALREIELGQEDDSLASVKERLRLEEEINRLLRERGEAGGDGGAAGGGGAAGTVASLLEQALALASERAGTQTGFLGGDLAAFELEKAGRQLADATLKQLEQFIAGTLAGFSFGLTSRAEGGPFAAGEGLMVGERGPEMAVFGQGGTILSNAMISSMVSAVQGLTRATSGMAAMPGMAGTQIVPIPIEKTVMNLNANYSTPQPEASLFRDMTTMQTLLRAR